MSWYRFLLRVTDDYMLSDPCVKSKILRKELEFFGKYLLSTLGPTVYKSHEQDNYHYPELFTQNSICGAELETFDTQLS